MPIADARYDVLFSDGGMAAGHSARNRLLVDMLEERMPDDWGDPGPLVSARLKAWRAPYVRSVEYAPARGRMRLWVNGSPRITRASRQYLRWSIQEEDPPAHDDPAWVLPP